jgi:3-methyladenine DNA glycosylase Tag
MEAPTRIEPQRLGDYLEVMSKAVFQSGISWKVVEAKWPGIREALHGFDAAAIASLTAADVDALASDQRVIRNRRKLEAIVDNARTLIELDATNGSFRDYLRSHPDFDALVADLRKHFRYLGDMGAYYFLYVIGEEVPPHEQFNAGHGRRR